MMRADKSAVAAINRALRLDSPVHLLKSIIGPDGFAVAFGPHRWSLAYKYFIHLMCSFIVETFFLAQSKFICSPAPIRVA